MRIGAVEIAGTGVGTVEMAGTGAVGMVEAGTTSMVEMGAISAAGGVAMGIAVSTATIGSSKVSEE